MDIYFDCFLLPSRGAFPFFVGVAHAMSRIARDHTDYAEFNKTLELPGTVKSYVSEEGFGGPNSKRKVLLIPFTADLNVSGIIDGVDESSLIDLTRDYWAHVTTSFLKVLYQKTAAFIQWAEYLTLAIAANTMCN